MVEDIEGLYHIMLDRVHLAMNGFELTTLVVKGTDCTGSCKSNHYTIMNTLYEIKSFKFLNITHKG